MNPALVQYGALGLLAFVIFATTQLVRLVLKAGLRELGRIRAQTEEDGRTLVQIHSELKRIRVAVEAQTGVLTPRELPLTSYPAPPVAESMPVPRAYPKEAPTVPRRKLPSRSGE